MKLTVPILLLVAINHAAEVKLPSKSNQEEETEEYETAKRALIEGNFGLRTPASFLDTDVQSVNTGIEYADSKQELSDKSPIQQLYATPVPRIAKISDVLTGQGPPFHTTINSHLYSPVSIYQPRLGSPTIYEASQSYTDQYKQLPQSMQTSREPTFPRFELPKQSKIFTDISGQSNFNPLEISKPFFGNLKSSDHYFPHFVTSEQSFPSYESSEQFFPFFKTTVEDNFPRFKTSGNSNISSSETSAQSTDFRSNTPEKKDFPSVEAPRQPSLSHTEYPQGPFEAGFAPHQFYQLINQLEIQPEHYTEAKTIRYPGPGEVIAPVDYLQAPVLGITYANQETQKQNGQQGQHEAKTPPSQMTKVLNEQKSSPKQNTHPNGAISYARFSQSLPETYYAQNLPVQQQNQEHPQPQQQKLSTPQMQPTPQLLLQSTPLKPLQTITTKQLTTLLPQYLTIPVQPTTPSQEKFLITLPQRTSSTQKEKVLTTSLPQLPTQRPQLLTTVESHPTNTTQSPEQLLSAFQSKQQQQATQSLTTIIPQSSSTAEPALEMKPEPSPGIHPLPYNFQSLLPPQKINQLAQQSYQASQPLYQPPQQSYQKLQQSHQQHSFQPPEESQQQLQHLYQQQQLRQQPFPQTKPQSQQQSQSFGKLSQQTNSIGHGNQAEYNSGNTVLTPLVQGPIYPGAEELHIPEPRFHAPTVVSPPTIQYFGKFAESIFDGVH